MHTPILRRLLDPGQPVASPKNLPGLRLWFDASQIPGLSDGAAVATWADASGNGHDATQATAAKHPTYKTGILNGLPIVRFDGVDDYVQTGAITALNGVQALTCYVVGKHSNNAAVFDIFIRSAYSNNSLLWGIFKNQDASRPVIAHARDVALSIRTSSVGPSDAQFHVHGLRWDNNTLRGWTDRIAGNAPATADAAVGTHTFTRLGATSHAEADFLTGDLAEVVVYTRALAHPERRGLEWYLSRKWGVALR